FYWYEVPCASPCQYASPNQLRINRRQHHLPEISGSGDPIGLRCFFDIIRYLVNPSNYCERHRPDHCRKDQDYRSKLLSALAGDSGQDENKDRRKEAENWVRLENVEDRKEDVGGSTEYRCHDLVGKGKAQ